MDSDDFAQIVAGHYEALYRFALSLTRAEADAQDLTQETFYVWASKGSQLRDRSKVKAWLFTTLHRAFLGTRRRLTRFPHQTLEEASPEDLPAFSPDYTNLADSPEVLSALAKVDEVYQAAVALFYLEDCSYQEIAEILEVPLGTVKSRIARGISQLRQLLGFVEPDRETKTVKTANQENGQVCDGPAENIGVADQ
jgi:RNA polymerase sigma-70 factor (ECF subfamily)